MKASRQHLDATRFSSTVSKVGRGIEKKTAGKDSMNPTRLGHKRTDAFRIAAKDLKFAIGQFLKAPEKFKLQLFPIDDTTGRKLLELNHNPYLELTLRPRKKISSVVKHLNIKWGMPEGNSSELVLFPFESQTKNIVDHLRWTMKDTKTTAADVLREIGQPEVFRLRYGWLHVLETENLQMPSLCFSSEGNLQSEDDPVHSQEAGSVSIIDTMKSSSCKLVGPSDVSAKALQSPTVGNGTLLSWVDCVTSVSVGQLLSETPDANLSNTLPAERNPSFKQIPMNCDSFDVAIADLIAQNQSSQGSTQMLHTSIWEAEETRHGFTIQNASSSRNGVVSTSSCRGLTQDHPSEEQLGDLKFDCSNLAGEVNVNPQPQASHSDMSNLGLSNLRWEDSLGPFEFGLSLKHINGGDTTSGLIGNSLDAFQSFSVFGMGKAPFS